MPNARSSDSEAEAQDSAAADTRERIFLAAEQLFAERGFDGVSVRDIVQTADVNLAALSYHFGSKSELLLSVFRKRTKELNRERLTRLREAEARHDGVAPLEDVLRALLGPPILWRDPATGMEKASRFITRAITEATPELRRILESDVSHLRGFLKAMAKALRFTVALPHQCTDTHFKRLGALSEGQCDTLDMPPVVERAVRFALGGIAAPAGSHTRKPERRAKRA